MERAARGEKRMPPVAVSVEAITKRVAELFGVPEARLRGRGRSREAARLRAVIAYLGREEASLPLRDVAKFFNRDEATLSLAVLRLETQMAVDPQLSARLSAFRRGIRRGASRKRIKQIIKV
jgi:chromosomal replication initiation ATPase DnaA